MEIHGRLLLDDKFLEEGTESWMLYFRDCQWVQKGQREENHPSIGPVDMKWKGVPKTSFPSIVLSLHCGSTQTVGGRLDCM